MFQKPTSLIEFILAEERKAKGATGDLTLLLTHIDYATRIIASHINRAGLVDILGSSGKKNVYEDEVQKLDEYSNQLFIDILSSTGVVSVLASEELEKPILVDKKGKYMVFFDPIDGSSNIDVNASVGTLFSIYHQSDSPLQPGEKQVAAGYVIYGSSTMFVYTYGSGVNGFTLDPSIGSFLLSHPSLRIPEKGNIYSANEGNSPLWDDAVKKYIDRLKNGDKPYKGRYIGTLVADLHRTLLKGGVFLYPSDKKHKTGKLRLLYEVSPAALLIKQAGGVALSDKKDPLTITPTSFSHTVPLVFGSPWEMKEFVKITQ